MYASIRSAGTRARALSVLAFLIACALSAEAADKAAPPALRPASIDEATRLKYPEQIVLVTSVGSNGVPNIITIGWTMYCSGSPPMVAIAVGKTRHSHALISETRQFVYAFPGADLEKEMLLCGTRSGRDMDKFKETGLTAVPASKVKPPLIGECLANFECEVEQAIDTGSHTIFVGRIVAAWTSERAGTVPRLFNLGRRQFKGLP